MTNAFHIMFRKHFLQFSWKAFTRLLTVISFTIYSVAGSAASAVSASPVQNSATATAVVIPAPPPPPPPPPRLPKIRLIVTGFEPFRDAGRVSSTNMADFTMRAIEQSLKRDPRFQNVQMSFVLLPVLFDSAAQAVMNELLKDTRLPTYIVSIGEGTTKLTIESNAVRVDSDLIDNAGRRRDSSLFAGFGDSLGVNFPVQDLYCALPSSMRKNVDVSYSPGAFVCNDLAYQVQQMTASPQDHQAIAQMLLQREQVRQTQAIGEVNRHHDDLVAKEQLRLEEALQKEEPNRQKYLQELERAKAKNLSMAGNPNAEFKPLPEYRPRFDVNSRVANIEYQRRLALQNEDAEHNSRKEKIQTVANLWKNKAPAKFVFIHVPKSDGIAYVPDYFITDVKCVLPGEAFPQGYVKSTQLYSYPGFPISNATQVATNLLYGVSFKQVSNRVVETRQKALVLTEQEVAPRNDLANCFPTTQMVPVEVQTQKPGPTEINQVANQANQYQFRSLNPQSRAIVQSSGQSQGFEAQDTNYYQGRTQVVGTQIETPQFRQVTVPAKGTFAFAISSQTTSDEARELNEAQEYATTIIEMFYGAFLSGSRQNLQSTEFPLPTLQSNRLFPTTDQDLARAQETIKRMAAPRLERRWLRAQTQDGPKPIEGTDYIDQLVAPLLSEDQADCYRDFLSKVRADKRNSLETNRIN